LKQAPEPAGGKANRGGGSPSWGGEVNVKERRTKKGFKGTGQKVVLNLNYPGSKIGSTEGTATATDVSISANQPKR